MKNHWRPSGGENVCLHGVGDVGRGAQILSLDSDLSFLEEADA